LTAVNAVRVPWSSASFLAYLGGLTILLAIVGLLSIASDEHSSGGLVFWALLVWAVLSALAFLSKWTGHFVTAGLLALSGVASFVVLLGALLDWFGWFPDTDSAFSGFRFWFLVLELAAVVASIVALRIFRFPPFVFAVAATTWFFITDLISGGEDWSAIVTIAYGLVLLTVAVSVDAGGSRVYGFWLHVASGLAIGGGLLWFFHDGDFDWIVIALVALLYIALGERLMRSSWVVFAAWALLQVATHFAEKWADVTFLAFFPLGFFLFPFFGYSDFEEEQNAHQWAGAFSYAVLGLLFIAIALLIARRRREAIAGAELL
jgi:hypothetical protein